MRLTKRAPLFDERRSGSRHDEKKGANEREERERESECWPQGWGRRKRERSIKRISVWTSGSVDVTNKYGQHVNRPLRSLLASSSPLLGILR